jgi:hypothetical protein
MGLVQSSLEYSLVDKFIERQADLLFCRRQVVLAQNFHHYLLLETLYFIAWSVGVNRQQFRSSQVPSTAVKKELANSYILK